MALAFAGRRCNLPPLMTEETHSAESPPPSPAGGRQGRRSGRHRGSRGGARRSRRGRARPDVVAVSTVSGEPAVVSDEVLETPPAAEDAPMPSAEGLSEPEPEPATAPEVPEAPEAGPAAPKPLPPRPATAGRTPSRDRRPALTAALEEVMRVIEELHHAAEQMELVLEYLEEAERQMIGDEREIAELRRALQRLRQPGPSQPPGHSHARHASRPHPPRPPASREPEDSGPPEPPVAQHD